MKDNKAVIFYFLMSIIFLDFGNQLKLIFQNPYFLKFNNAIFSITQVKNTGGAFSLFEDNAKILAVFGIIVIIYLTIYVIRNITFKDKFSLLSLTLFCAGTLGNILERLTQGYVIDYFKLNFIDFPVFNAFDIMICTGIALYIIFVLFKKDETKLNDNVSNNK